jgi:tripeptide aminopeptidase
MWETPAPGAVESLEKMLAIPGPSGDEAAILQWITQRLQAAGADGAALVADTAHQRSHLGGRAGNLIFKLPGRGTLARAPRRLLMAHVDTVPLCVNARPRRRGSRIISANPESGLGADNRCGAAAVLFAACSVVRHADAHPPLTFVWTVQEEVGLLGARHVDKRLLGKPRLGFNFDGSSAAKVTVGATGAYRIHAAFRGIAAHAGVRPRDGASAITMAAITIGLLHRGGWLGRVVKRGAGGGEGTGNVGVIEGGAATNVVTDHVAVRAEVRSHDPRFRQVMLQAYRDACERGAASVKTAAGEAGRLEFESRQDYESFHLPDDSPCVVEAERVLRALGEEPVRTVSNGGLDANWMVAHGVPTVTLGAGQENPHTVKESLNLYEFGLACRTAEALARGT